jgi:hypothetical protein
MSRRIPYHPTQEALFTPGCHPFFHDWHPRSDSALCAELSRLAYCTRHAIATVLHRIGMQLGEVFSESDDNGTFGFLAHSEQRSILVFRGTRPHDRQNVLDDLNFLPTTWTVGDEVVGRVHRGFSDAMRRVWPQVEAATANLTKPTLVTGHSLGAALAVLAASRVPCQRLITIGAPRVGNATFRDFVERRVEVIRVQGCCDMVCMVPPPPIARHCGTRHYIDLHGRLHVRPKRTFTLADQTRAHLDFTKKHAGREGNLLTRALADHAPINYVLALHDAETAP